MNDGWMELRLNNAADREAVALALVRAGYTVKIVKYKEDGKAVVALRYRGDGPC